MMALCVLLISFDQVESLGSCNMTYWAGRVSGTTNGAGTNANFFAPQGIFADRTGTMLVADGSSIRRIVPTKTVIPAITPMTGSWGYVTNLKFIPSGTASANPPTGIQMSGICGDTANNLYIYGRTQYTSQRILKFTHTVIPISTSGYTNTATFSAFAGTGTRASSTDTTFGLSDTLGDGGAATSGFIFQTSVCLMDPVSGIFYFTTSADSKIRMVTKDNKIMLDVFQAASWSAGHSRR
jgi:hypothetical protein